MSHEISFKKIVPKTQNPSNGVIFFLTKLWNQIKS